MLTKWDFKFDINQFSDDSIYLKKISFSCLKYDKLNRKKENALGKKIIDIV